MKKHWLIILFFLGSFSIQAQTQFVAFNDSCLYYEGRILNHDNAAELSWPGTSVTIRFIGNELSATMVDSDTADYYNAIVDGEVHSIIHVGTEKKKYKLVSGLADGKHTVQLFKRTEWDKGKTLFYGFELPSGARVLPKVAPKKRKIEFYGNSITCGYANEDAAGQDRWYGYFENNYEAYGAITARHFDANYSCIAKGGIGIMVSWFPLLMPEMYDRTDPTDSLSSWDFSKFTPDLVVINLFQNDSWLVHKPEHEQFIFRFGTKPPTEEDIIHSYKKFVSSIREKYPNAPIICALGSMDATREGSPWPGYIEKALGQMNDPDIHTLFFPFKGSNGHPNVAEQHKMADQLIGYIEKTFGW
jgi:hypothetical protein